MIALLLLGLTSIAGMRVQTIDLIELNHMFSPEGRPTFSQVIFWDVNPVTQRLHVREWHMVDSVEFDVTPRGNTQARIKFDGITVVGSMFRESWSQVDPEREDLKVWPDRMPLARRPKQ